MIANRDEIEMNEQRDGRAPGERDLQIYAAVRVDGRRQVDVAAEFGISQGRVSQIVRRVNHWRVGMGLEAELERRDRKSVDRWLEQLRIEKLYEETMELYRKSKEPRRRERRGKDHRGEWSSESIDHQPGNLQCLKFAGRLIELRRQLDEDLARPDQSMDSPRSRIDEYEAFRLLVDMRNDAMRRGDVPKDDDSEFVVRRLMWEMTGQKPHVTQWEREAQQAREAEVNAAAACLMEEPHVAANEAAIINDISAGAEGEAARTIAANGGAHKTWDEDAVSGETGGGANIGGIFSSASAIDYGLAEDSMTEKWGAEKWARECTELGVR